MSAPTIREQRLARPAKYPFFVTATFERLPFEASYTAGRIGRYVGHARTLRGAARMANKAGPALRAEGRKGLITVTIFELDAPVRFLVSSS